MLFTERLNMRYLRCLILTLAAALVLMSVADSQEKKKKDLGKEKEPTMPKSMDILDVQGRSFKEWQKDIKDKDPTRREIAIKNILQFGPEKAYEAVPDILAELKKHNPKGPRVDLSVCATGAMALSTIFQYKRDPDPKDVKAAVAIYRAFLKDEQLMLRVRAVQGIAYLGPTCREALPEVISLAKEPSTWEARKEAVQMLGFIGFEDKGTPKIFVMSEVFKALDDNASQVRIAAIRSCASLAMKGEVPLKNQVFGKFKAAIDNDPDKHVVLAAHLAHMTLDGKVTAAHLNPLVKALKDENPELRLDALRSIGALGKEAKAAIPALTESTDDPEATVAVNAVIVVATLDPEGSRPLLTRIKNNTKQPVEVRAAAEDALAYQENMAKQKKKTDK